ncbi:MAG TPA: lanthionine synthetase C family protein, partial [Polyangiaceae bacterium]|nr:lanthionine synthetase C family protein [Polyangiaceae bacterium]
MSLLRGPALKEARVALAELSARYLRLRPSKIADASLAGGLSGVALVHASLDDAFPGAGHAACAEHALERALEQLARAPLGPGLHSGLAGVGWVLANLVGGADDEDDPCAAVDSALAGVLEPATWTDPYDLIEGLVGLGVYALERAPRPAAKRLLARIVDHLGRTARHEPPGVAWWSDPEWVPPEWRTIPHPDWNLGVAHGVPGVIALLGRVVAADVDAPTRAKARRLLEGAVAWLLAQELPLGAGGCFAHAVAPGLPRAPARVAWCYGDPGIAAALLIAARAAREPAWAQAAIRVARSAASRAEASTGVVDAGLCHGAAGVAHIFHRLSRATDDARLADGRVD